MVTVPQLRDFLSLLPDWDELAIGLEAISIYAGNGEWLGMCNPGVVVITAWEQDLWWDNAHRDWVNENRAFLDQLGVEIVEPSPDAAWLELRWTEPQARAFMLLDVLLHELGHHHDRMTTRARKRTGRGEPYAISYANRARDLIWDHYVQRFGI